MQFYDQRESSFNKSRTFPGWNSNPHRDYGLIGDPLNWTGPGPGSVRDSINWTHRVLRLNYNTKNRPGPEYVGQEMQRQHGGKEQQRKRVDLVQEWQPKPNREEPRVGSKSCQDLEAWASRYYHSLLRKNQNIKDVLGAAHETFRSKPAPPPTPVRCVSPKTSCQRRFSHPPNYSPPPPYSSSQNLKKNGGALARGLPKAGMEHRLGRTPDHGEGMLKFPLTEYGRCTNAAPRRRAGGTVFCLVSRMEVPDPSEEALKNMKRREIKKVQPESQTCGFLELGPYDHDHQELRNDALEKIRSKRRQILDLGLKEDGSNDTSESSLRHVERQEQSTRLPFWKEPKSKGLEKTREPNQYPKERLSNPNHNRGLVVIDATCVMVKVELLVSPEKELVQYIHEVQNNDRNAEVSNDAFFSKHEKASQTSSLKNEASDSSQRENNTGQKIPEDQSKGSPETKESERQLNRDQNSSIAKASKLKEKDQSSVLKAVRMFESLGSMVKNSDEQQLKFEGEVNESPIDKPEMKNLIFGRNAGSITITNTIHGLDPKPSGICMENIERFNQECHDGGSPGLPFYEDHTEDPNPIRSHQTYGEDVSLCPSTLGQQDRSRRNKPSSPSNFSQDHVKITTALFGQEGQKKEEDLYPNTDHQNPRLVLEKESEISEQKVMPLRPTLLGDQTIEDLNPKLGSYSETFGPESSNLTLDVTPSFFGAHMGSRSFLSDEPDGQNLHPTLKRSSNARIVGEDMVEGGRHTQVDAQNKTNDLQKLSSDLESTFGEKCWESPAFYGDIVETKSSPDGALNEKDLQEDVSNLHQTLLLSKKAVQAIPEPFHEDSPDANHGVNAMQSSSHGNVLETEDGNHDYPNVLVRNVKDISESLGLKGSEPVEVPCGGASLSDKIQNPSLSRSSASLASISSSSPKPHSSFKFNPKSLWDAVSRIRRHTAPDSESEEDENTERWPGPDDEDVELGAGNDGKGSTGDAEERPEESDGTESSCSLDSQDSNNTVIQGLNIRGSEEEEEDDDEEGSNQNHEH